MGMLLEYANESSAFEGGVFGFEQSALCSLGQVRLGLFVNLLLGNLMNEN
jgi:hypothetical protein